MTRSLTLLTGLLILLPGLSLEAPLAMAPALVLLTATVLLPWLWKGASLQATLHNLRHNSLLWLAGLLLVWGLASLIWSPEPRQGAALLPRVVLVLAIGAGFARMLTNLPPSQLRPVELGLLIGGAIALAWSAIDIVLVDYALSDLLTNAGHSAPNIPKRGLTFLSLLVWPAAYLLGRRYGVFAAIAGAAALTALTFASHAGAAKMALLVGGAAFVAAWFVPRITAVLAALFLTVSILTAPVTVPQAIERFDLLAHTEASTRHRLVIWDFVSERALEKPLTGWGFNMARSIPGGRGVDPLTGGELIPLHPHNAPLQWWVELGLPGALLGLMLTLILLRRAITWPPTRTGKATAVATLVSALAISAVGYGAWQLWWLSSLVFAAGAVIAAARSPSVHDMNKG